MEPKTIWKNVIKETSIQAANFIWSVYLLIMIDTLLLRPYPPISIEELQARTQLQLQKGQNHPTVENNSVYKR